MSDPLVSQIEQYVVSCFDRESALRVDELARCVGISRATLHRRCMTQLGDPPSEILQRARLARAQELLSLGDLTTCQVAYRAGFGTRRSIFRAFRQRLGTTPRASAECAATE